MTEERQSHNTKLSELDHLFTLTYTPPLTMIITFIFKQRSRKSVGGNR